MNGGNRRQPQEKADGADVAGQEKAGSQHKIEFQDIISDSIEQQYRGTDPACGFQANRSDQRGKKSAESPKRFIGCSQMKPKTLFVIQEKGKTDSKADNAQACNPDQGSGTSFDSAVSACPASGNQAIRKQVT